MCSLGFVDSSSADKTAKGPTNIHKLKKQARKKKQQRAVGPKETLEIDLTGEEESNAISQGSVDSNETSSYDVDQDMKEQEQV